MIYPSIRWENIENHINLRMGFVELIDKEVSADLFNLVHVSNWLDHSFDALMGIYQHMQNG